MNPARPAPPIRAIFSPFARASDFCRVHSGMSRLHIEDSYPLSPMQEGMLFHTLYAPRAGVDIEQMACAFHEPLDAALFRRAWEHVVAAREVLRTSFRFADLDRPLQEIAALPSIPWLEEDWRALSLPEQE